MDNNRFQQFKKMIRFLATALLVVGVTAVFICFWKENYNDGIVFPFYFKGYWLVGAFYAFFFILFIGIYGGMSYGYLKNTNIVFSQTLALLCANVLIYLETVLLSARIVTLVPIVEMTILQIMALMLYSFSMDWLFKKMFPPHKVTVLYQEYDPSDMLRKVRTRKDRYLIKEVVNVDMKWEELLQVIDKSEAIMIYDVHSETRNKILKI